MRNANYYDSVKVLTFTSELRRGTEFGSLNMHVAAHFSIGINNERFTSHKFGCPMIQITCYLLHRSRITSLSSLPFLRYIKTEICIFIFPALKVRATSWSPLQQPRLLHFQSIKSLFMNVCHEAPNCTKQTPS